MITPRVYATGSIAMLPVPFFYYFNIPVFQWLNGHNADWLDALMGVVSGLGDGLVIALLLGLVAFYHWRAGLAGLAAFILSGLLAQLLKRAFDMPRPPTVLEHVHILGAALHSHSFPSGHATSCGVMIAGAFLLFSHRHWQAWVVAVLFTLAALGRIYGGVHFPLDVWVGLWLGAGSMWWCWQRSRRWPLQRWSAWPWTPRLLGLIVLIESAVLGLGYHIQPQTAQPLCWLLPPLALALLWRYWQAALIRPALS